MTHQDNTDEEMAVRQERPPVRPEGRAGHLTTEEKTAIRLEYAESRALWLTIS